MSPQIASEAAGDAAVISHSLHVPEAFEAIFDRHFDAVHKYLARRVGRERADDLASQTFVVAFERRGRFRLDVSDARPWLLGIATKLLANDRRAEHRLLETFAQLSGEARDGVNPACSALDSERDVAAALAKLDPRQLDVLLLHAWAELSYDEIAAALAIPVGTVRSRLARARTSVQADFGGKANVLPLHRTQREVS